VRDTSATPQNDAPIETRTPTPTKARVIPIDANTEAMSLFSSEQKTAKPETSHAAPTDVAHPAAVPLLPPEPHPAPRTEIARPPQVAKRGLRTRDVLVAVLALAVIGEGGYIAYSQWRARAAAPPETGSVTVTSEPSGSPVMIDGTPRGATPLTVQIEPGSHRIEVGSGAQAHTRHVTVTRGGDVSMHIGLTAAPAAGVVAGTGGLHIATDPPGARVLIDNEPHGVAPVTVSNLKAGDHIVSVRGATGEAINRTVTVQEAAVSSLIISMNPRGAFASGWLAISSGVPLQILENGALLGTTETPRILLPAGTHELELVNTELGYRLTRSVQISAGQTAAVRLNSPLSAISINALPWAEVWIDGQRIGETPIGNHSIAIGRHELMFRHPELGEQRRTVTVGMTSPERVSVDMRRK
jgi:hypothetical protein